MSNLLKSALEKERSHYSENSVKLEFIIKKS